MRVRSLVVVAIALCAAATHARAAADPRYESWARHKPGTRVVLAGAMEMQGMRNESEQIFTLLEVSPQQVVIEAKSAAMVMGQRKELPGQRITIPATTPDDPTTRPAGVDMKEAREPVNVAGKTYDAKVVTTTGSQQGMSVVVKTWTTPDVPGTVVKMEMTTTSGPQMTQRSELKSIELK